MESGIPEDLDLRSIPAHIACVMDGNGRWAQARGLPRTEGHKAGERALFDVVEGALSIGVQWLTVYAFSTENWRRPQAEVRFLLGFNDEILTRRRDELHARGVRIQFVGRSDRRMPGRLVQRMDRAVALTRLNRRMTLTVAFNYGGRAEIVDAVREIVASGITAEQISEHTIANRLYNPEMPDPDLMIRTSGECRTSNFLLWQLAYSELYFTDVPWPDFRREHLLRRGTCLPIPRTPLRWSHRRPGPAAPLRPTTARHRRRPCRRPHRRPCRQLHRFTGSESMTVSLHP